MIDRTYRLVSPEGDLFTVTVSEQDGKWVVDVGENYAAGNASVWDFGDEGLGAYATEVEAVQAGLGEAVYMAVDRVQRRKSTDRLLAKMQEEVEEDRVKLLRDRLVELARKMDQDVIAATVDGSGPQQPNYIEAVAKRDAMFALIELVEELAGLKESSHA